MQQVHHPLADVVHSVLPAPALQHQISGGVHDCLLHLLQLEVFVARALRSHKGAASEGHNLRRVIGTSLWGLLVPTGAQDTRRYCWRNRTCSCFVSSFCCSAAALRPLVTVMPLGRQEARNGVQAAGEGGAASGSAAVWQCSRQRRCRQHRRRKQRVAHLHQALHELDAQLGVHFEEAHSCTGQQDRKRASQPECQACTPSRVGLRRQKSTILLGSPSEVHRASTFTNSGPLLRGLQGQPQHRDSCTRPKTLKVHAPGRELPLLPLLLLLKPLMRLSTFDSKDSSESTAAGTEGQQGSLHPSYKALRQPCTSLTRAAEITYAASLQTQYYAKPVY